MPFTSVSIGADKALYPTTVKAVRSDSSCIHVTFDEKYETPGAAISVSLYGSRDAVVALLEEALDLAKNA